MPSTARSSSTSSSSTSASTSYRQDVYTVLDEQFLPRIQAVFYSIFHPTEGAKIVYQVPEGIISTTTQSQADPSSSALDDDEKDTPAKVSHQLPIFDFKSVSEFIIPKAPLCGRLISYSVASPNGQTYKILSLPIILLDQAKYPRKSFIFNVAFVFDGRADTRAYEPIVRKCARELRDLETSSSFLSRSQFRMYWVIEQLFEDLNSYCESFVALPEAPHTKYVNDLRREAMINGKQGSLSKQSSRKPSPSILKASEHIRSTSGISVDKESLRDALEQNDTIPPLTIGDPTIPTETPRIGSRRSSADHLSLASPPQSATLSPPARKATGDSSPHTFSGGVRSSSSSLIGSPGVRPGLGRSKTLAALAVNETTVNALQSVSARETRERDWTEGALSVAQSMSRNASLEGNIYEQRGSSADMEMGLSESIMSLRTIGAEPELKVGPRRISDAVGALPPATMLAPGKREPPHGLGRTVRDAINLKLFPTYSNPKDINDWDVPVTLLDLRKRVTGNWDLTMCKVLPFIDGINHVKRIAQLADADLELTRQCIEHLLYYRCIITTDTFQFTNMYTVRPSIAVMAEDEVIMVECAFYVTKPGYSLPSWPKLLSLYSSLRPALTVNDWIDENDVDALGIDIRRFVSFGVIKGFLRRVHRFPVLLQDSRSPPNEVERRDPSSSRSRERGPEGDASRISQMQISISPEPVNEFGTSRKGRLRHASETDGSLGAGSIVSGGTSTGRRRAVESHRKTRATVMDVANVALDAAAVAKEQDRRTTPQSTSGRVSIRTPLPRGGSSATIRPVANPSAASNKDTEEHASSTGGRRSNLQIPPGLVELLDGTHPDDELCVRFGKSWSEILAILIKIGRRPNLAHQQSSGRRGNLAEQEETAANSGWANTGEADESAIAGMSSFYLPGASGTNRRRSMANSLPRYRNQQSNNPASSQGGVNQSGFSRYASTGDGTSAWGPLSGIQSGSLGGDDSTQIDRESIASGDLGRVKIIIK